MHDLKKRTNVINVIRIQPKKEEDYYIAFRDFVKELVENSVGRYFKHTNNLRN